MDQEVYPYVPIARIQSKKLLDYHLFSLQIRRKKEKKKKLKSCMESNITESKSTDKMIVVEQLGGTGVGCLLDNIFLLIMTSFL